MGYPFVYITCPKCGLEYGFIEGRESECTSVKCRAVFISIKSKDMAPRGAQLHSKEKPILWTKTDPETGKVEIRYPGRNDGDMPSYYKSQGYEKTEFNSYQEHQKFCRENGLVNHKAEGIRDQADRDGR